MKPPSPSLLSAMARADWERLLPSLIAYAERRLRQVGWAGAHDHEPSRLSVMELVNMAIETCLSGERRWNETNPLELGAFLCGVMRSIASNEKKKATRQRVHLDSDAVHRATDLASDEDPMVAEERRRAIISAFEACVASDAELESLFHAILEGHTKRDELVFSLGWSPDAVSAAKVKLQRRLIARFPEQFASAKKKRRAS